MDRIIFLNPFLFACLFTIIMLIPDCLSMETSNINGSTLCLENERQALLKFKHDLTDPSNRLSSWVSNECCLWSGIICQNITGHVTEIHLQNLAQFQGRHFGQAKDLAKDHEDFEQTKLGGKINPSLLNLNNLRHLDLSNNNFLNQGRIPIFIGSISSLEYLNLSYSGFSGNIPHQLGNLSKIRCLDLSPAGSYLISDSLEWLLGLKSLQYLDMYGVNLSKAVNWVHDIGSLPSLRELHLSACSLKDVSLPISSKVNFTSLLILDLYGNGFTSTIPQLLFSLTRLVSLDIRNNFIPPIPNALRNITSLRVFRSGGYEERFSIPKWFYSLTQLEEIDLSNTGLEGIIANEIGNLTSLINLDLEGNGFQWESPKSLGKLCNLKVIKLSYNYFDRFQINELFGSFSKCKVRTLEVLEMGWCNLTGHFPYELGDLKNLTELDLNHNSISGPISTLVPRLSQLRRLDLSCNQFNGSLPETLGKLELLEGLELQDNKFTGILTNLHFSNLNRLWYLDLSNNHFNGSLPENIGKLGLLEVFYTFGNSFRGIVTDLHFANLSRLVFLDCCGNKLTLKVSDNWVPSFQIEYLYLSSWKLGPKFPSWLQSQHELLTLDMSYTGISDSIPHWFWENTPNLYYLNFSSNQIFGQIPYKRKKFGENLEVVGLSSNLFTGPLPYDTFARASEFIDLSNNSFSETIHHFLCHGEDEPFTTHYLNLGNNLLSGPIPDCWENWQSLNVLILEKNNFTGSIPNSVGQLRDLVSLHLRNNSLSGELPQGLQNCTKLKVVDMGYNKFTGKIPSWIEKTMGSLVAFILRSNRFHGDIPRELCHLSSLQFLDLAQNNLAGLIPRCFHNLTAMSVMNGLSEAELNYFAGHFGSSKSNIVDYGVWVAKGSNFEYKSTLLLLKSMDLSGNKFSGDVPEGLTRLAGLRLLNLSQNHLIGLIPQRIGDMKSLEFLDFSLNHLSGEIPSSMSSLTYLSDLNLSYNNLTGQIPSNTQIQSMGESNFIGNNLCGAPLPECREKTVVTNTSQGVEEVGGEQNEEIWFLGSIALGFVVGFWAFLGPLLLKVSWRKKFFHMLDLLGYKVYDAFI